MAQLSIKMKLQNSKGWRGGKREAEAEAEAEADTLFTSQLEPSDESPWKNGARMFSQDPSKWLLLLPCLSSLKIAFVVLRKKESVESFRK